jgi:hypothetical protein
MATRIVTDRKNDGLELTPIGPGMESMSVPTKELFRLVPGRKIRHSGNQPSPAIDGGQILGHQGHAGQRETVQAEEEQGLETHRPDSSRHKRPVQAHRQQEDGGDTKNSLCVKTLLLGGRKPT